ncbi:hypothetical protein [Rhizobium sp. BE258]|uniref:hypothetical protein n=1 Tax=Rhizobium sp. BE258 TaxID=2817722 RepID=UPI002857FB49|nr:hypothetical protein [Rhizobium sp. BE258]MDR7143540.1 hypothetical protein [Rhizobium sp. BE258]
MKARMLVAVSVAGAAALLSGCVDRANSPVLYPVGTPVNPSFVAHTMCMGEGNAAYDESMRLHKERSQISGQYDQGEGEAVSRSAARRAYTACASSEGYRAVYDQ